AKETKPQGASVQQSSVEQQGGAAPIMSKSATVGGKSCTARPLRDYAEKTVGGNVTTAELWPGFVAIGAEAVGGGEAEDFCGGILIDERTVLTAGHCLKNADGKSLRSIRSTSNGWPLVVLPNIGDITNDAPNLAAHVVEGGAFSEPSRKYTTDASGRE